MWGVKKKVRSFSSITKGHLRITALIVTFTTKRRFQSNLKSGEKLGA